MPGGLFTWAILIFISPPDAGQIIFISSAVGLILYLWLRNKRRGNDVNSPGRYSDAMT